MSIRTWFRSFRIRQLLNGHSKSPDLYDNLGYPYWLIAVNSDEEFIEWWVNNGRDHIASVQVQCNDDNTLTLNDLVIHEESLRGYGLGSQLLNHVKQYAQESGKSAIVGYIGIIDHQENESLPDWYQHHGFVVTKPAQNGEYADIRFALE